MFTRARFRSHYAEFAMASDDLIDRALVESAEDLDPATWGSRRDRAHGLLCAVKLSRSQFSQNALLTEQAKVWEAAYDRELAAATCALRLF